MTDLSRLRISVAAPSVALIVALAVGCGGGSAEAPAASAGPDWAAMRAAFVETGAVPDLLQVPDPETAELLPLPEALIGLDTEAGRALLADADARADYTPLMEAFESQQYGSFCGVATSVTVLDAMGIEDVDQDNFFEATTEIAPQVQVLFGGMNLETLAALLDAHGVAATARHANNMTVEQLRSTIVENLEAPGDYVAVNYLRAAIGQEGGGHISPIAAYDAQTDRVLVLDVSAYKYPPFWVSVQDLYDAANTVDSDGGLTRGFVFVGPVPLGD